MASPLGKHPPAIRPARGAARNRGGPRDRVRFQTGHSIAPAGPATILERLTKGRAGMTLPLLELTDVRVRIPVEDADWPIRDRVAQEMAIGRLVPASQHNDERALRQEGRDDLAEPSLIGLEIT